jgi:para-nitrobenzyl esterase
VIARRTLLGAAAAAPFFRYAAWATPIGMVVDVPAGRFASAGHSENQRGAWAFKGIRYGQTERFHAPRPLPRAIGTIRADTFGPSCPQRDDIPNQREDCLTLNIWTPDTSASARRPVMVYFHGGAYSSGTVIDPQVHGRKLAEQGDVVVTVNHRLNALGYCYLARLDPRFPDSGNAGQLDLILALRWVRDNIAGFGGDPSRVMLFGQSGGGAKIATLMATPAARGLFHTAATMSGQQVTASGPLNATRRARAWLARLGVPEHDLSTLMTMPVARLVAALDAEDPILGGGVYFGPVLDMTWLHRHPFWPDAAPQGNAIPLILGNTRDETRGFIDPAGPQLRGIDWTNIAERIAPELRIDIAPEWVVARYRERYPEMSATDLFYAPTTAARSWRGQLIEAEARARAGAPTWVYQLDFASPTRSERGAQHGHDIPLVFGTLDAERSLTGTGPAAQALSARMMAAFVSLARRGDPNVAGAPHWPRYALSDRATMRFDTVSRVEPDPRRWERELFARVPYIQPGS